jgi:hypothetical protein
MQPPRKVDEDGDVVAATLTPRRPSRGDGAADGLEVPFGVVLAHVDEQIGHSLRVPGVPHQRVGSERPGDPIDDFRARALDDMTDRRARTIASAAGCPRPRSMAVAAWSSTASMAPRHASTAPR